jgi:hypothetical protein
MTVIARILPYAGALVNLRTASARARGLVELGHDTGEPGALLFRAYSPDSHAAFDRSLDGMRLVAAEMRV